jgi:hypothetical protein
MFCPQCRAEYRPGFARCADCQIDLVEQFSPLSPQDREFDANSNPLLAPKRFFLAWLLPMCVYVLCVFGLSFKPQLLGTFYFGGFFVCYHVACVLGTLWMCYQAVRYEKRVGRYFLLAFVPFMFVWYSLVRSPLHKEFQSKSDFIR